MCSQMESSKSLQCVTVQPNIFKKWTAKLIIIEEVTISVQSWNKEQTILNYPCQ